MNFLKNNSNDSLSFTSKNINSSNVLVGSSFPFVPSTKMSVVEKCQSVPTEKPSENSHSKIHAEGLNRIHNSLSDSSVSESQVNRKTEIVNQLENKQNNFVEKSVSIKECSDVLSKCNLHRQTVAEKSIKKILQRKETSCSQYNELSDNRNKSLGKSHSEIYTQVNQIRILDSTLQLPNELGLKMINKLENKTNDTDIGKKSASIPNPVIVPPNRSVKDITLAEKCVKQLTMRNRKSASYPEKFHKI